MTPAHPVIDSHHHVGYLPDWHDVSGTRGGLLDGDAAIGDDIERRVAVMDAEGVDQAIVIPTHGYLRPGGVADTRFANNMIARYSDLARERFPAAIGVVEPLHGDAALDELDRIATDLGLAGVSFHTRFQGVSISSPWVRTCLERMCDLGLVPYIHVIAEVVDEAPWRLVQLARDLPEVTFVALDAFSSTQRTSEVGFLADLADNVVWEISLSRDFSRIGRLAHRIGAQRIVYGTDQYSVPSAEHGTGEKLRQVRDSDLDEDQTSDVLGGNICRILDLACPVHRGD